MPRGIKVDIDQYLTNIQPYLEVGCSLYEACLHAIVPYTTVVDYQNNDDEIRKKIERMGNVPILKARQSVVGDMENNSELALKYLERKKKDEFGLRTENVNTLKNADGETLKLELDVKIAPIEKIDEALDNLLQ